MAIINSLTANDLLIVFNVRYWEQAAEIAQTLEDRDIIQKKISIRNFIEQGGDKAEWESTEEAVNIHQPIKAHQVDKTIVTKQAKSLNNKTKTQKKSFRRSFMKLFTTSKLGLGTITSTGIGKRRTCHGLHRDLAWQATSY